MNQQTSLLLALFTLLAISCSQSPAPPAAAGAGNFIHVQHAACHLHAVRTDATRTRNMTMTDCTVVDAAPGLPGTITGNAGECGRLTLTIKHLLAPTSYVCVMCNTLPATCPLREAGGSLAVWNRL